AAGSFLYVAAAHLPNIAEHTPASQFFGLAQGIQVDLGEAGGFLRAHMGLTTQSPDTASQLARMVDGLIAFGSLMSDKLGSAVELLRALRLDSHDSEVTVDFDIAVQRLMQILTSLGDEDHGDEHHPFKLEVK